MVGVHEFVADALPVFRPYSVKGRVQVAAF